MDTRHIVPSWPWNLSTGPTRSLLGRPARSALTGALEGATTMMSPGPIGRVAPFLSVQLPCRRFSIAAPIAANSSAAIWALPSWTNGTQKAPAVGQAVPVTLRSEEHTSELQSLMRISYAVFCLKQKRIRYDNLEQNHN